MAIPIRYNLRNLVVRRMSTVLTGVSIALAVAVLLAAMALRSGLRGAFQATGDPLNVLVLRKGASSELSSSMARSVFRDLVFAPGIARGQDGPLASLELVTTISLPLPDRPIGMNITLRGLVPVGTGLRKVRLLEGRWFRSGQREIVVGASVAKRHPAVSGGGSLRFGKGEWQIVGVMEDGGSVVDSEIWGDLNQVSSDFNRPGALSSVLVRAEDAAAVPALINRLNDDRRLNVAADTERSYYDRQTTSGAPLVNLGLAVSVLMAVGSCFAAMNTMYAAVARRGAEIGTLRVLGFSRAGILASFLFESLLLSALGGVLGCVLVLPLNGFATGVGNFTTLSDVVFHFHTGPEIMAAGIGFALLMGAAGGFFPARRAARKEILAALREG